MNMQQYIKSIRTTSNVGLWTSLGIALITIIVIQVSKYEFHPDPRTYRFFLIAGSVLAIGAALVCGNSTTSKSGSVAMPSMSDICI